jgi:lycopene beta-cyclase
VIKEPRTYDYIIAGMGAAGLSLAVHMAKSGLLADKKLLLIDKERKEQNDRTWCFWETAPGPFESVVYRRWSRAWFHAEGYGALLDLEPYTYKMIRGIDYYRYCFEYLSAFPQVELLFSPVEEINPQDGYAEVKAGGVRYTARFVFNSILFEQPKPAPGKYYLLQHFKGWVVETPGPAFNPGEATLMDFRPSQAHGTTFIYVMPFSETEALVEYTLFSEALLPDGAYDEGIRTYLQKHMGITDFRVKSSEFGVIPMTNHRFARRDGNLLYIGTAGGQTKASSGYTFRFIQKHVAAITDSLVRHGHPFDLPTAMVDRFYWYDSVLLNVLHHGTLEGWYVFRELFRKNKASTILRFLDNETTLAQEFRLLNSLPQWPFMKAGIRELVRG